MPLRSTSDFNSSAAGASSWRSISRSIRWMQRHRRAGLGEAVGRFQSEQAAADHDDALLLRGQRQQQIDVAAVAEGVHAGKIGAGHVEPQRRRAGGKHQPGERDALLVGDLEFAAADIDLGGDGSHISG